MSTDCEPTSSSKLLIDLNKINRLKLKSSNPKMGHIVVTPKKTTKTFTAFLTKKYFEEVTLQNFREALGNLATYLKDHQIKTLNRKIELFGGFRYPKGET